MEQRYMKNEDFDEWYFSDPVKAVHINVSLMMIGFLLVGFASSMLDKMSTVLSKLVCGLYIPTM